MAVTYSYWIEQPHTSKPFWRQWCKNINFILLSPSRYSCSFHFTIEMCPFTGAPQWFSSDRVTHQWDRFTQRTFPILKRNVVFHYFLLNVFCSSAPRCSLSCQRGEKRFCVCACIFVRIWLFAQGRTQCVSLFSQPRTSESIQSPLGAQKTRRRRFPLLFQIPSSQRADWVAIRRENGAAGFFCHRLAACYRGLFPYYSPWHKIHNAALLCVSPKAFIVRDFFCNLNKKIHVGHKR